MSGRESAVTIGLLFPDLLGTYGDSGNAVILAQRLQWRGIEADIVTVHAGDPVPASCELYVVGGGEDLPQALAARQLGPPGAGPLARAVDGGAAVLAVCAGLQILGASFVGPDGVQADGLGLVDCTTRRGRGARAVGEIVVDPMAPLTPASAQRLRESRRRDLGRTRSLAIGVGSQWGRQWGRLRRRRGVGRPGLRDLPPRPRPGP